MKPLPVSFSLIGHKERSFDIRFSSDGTQLLSGSQDGTARIWNVASRKCTATLKHSSECEVLRCAFLSHSSGEMGQGSSVGESIIATGGADGILKIWSHDLDSGAEGIPPAFQVVCDLDHSGEQIYACESFRTGTSPLRLLSAAGSVLYLWDLGSGRAFSERVSFQGDLRGRSDPFGGPRNPDNQTFIFDAKPSIDKASAMYGCAAAALSDGTIRFRDFRSASDALSVDMTGQSGSSGGSHGSVAPLGSVLKSLRRGQGGGDAAPVIASEDANTHPTSVHWSTIDAGGAVAASLSSGDVAIIDVRMGVVRSRFIGCHRSTCFGVTSTASASSAVLGGPSGGAYISWSLDGSIRIWSDDFSTLDLYSASTKHPFAVFSVATASSGPGCDPGRSLRLALAGGSGGNMQTSFLGEPIIVADVAAPPKANQT